MIKIITFIFIFFYSNVLYSQNSLKPLYEVIDEMPISTSKEKFSSLNVMFLRCSAFTEALHDLEGSSNVTWNLHSELFFKGAAIARSSYLEFAFPDSNQDINKQLEKSIRWTKDKIDKTKVQYIDLMESAYLNTGKYFQSDKFLSYELKTCAEIGRPKLDEFLN